MAGEPRPIAGTATPETLASYFGLNPRVRQSGLGLAQHGRISKHGRAHARGPCWWRQPWAASKAPGPLRAFVLQIRAKRGHQVAAVAVARKLAVICWHLLTKDTDYLWQRPALVAHKVRSMELQAGQPKRKGNKRGPSHEYHVKELRDRDIEAARQAERAYDHAVKNWQPARSPSGYTGAAKEARR
ncbi:transposase [Paracraurococcus lichenis]|uniref:Transposase n=1 Tax=Paracraurococcus lichenis TaxID=3064888 RepID=A0ABT9E2M3_9PROT|nr:transposase [Paracraurococcus sp. LOR1-02]MDO9710399.1 transposase [Paracraurococcus sp. LOR1-02]